VNVPSVIDKRRWDKQHKKFDIALSELLLSYWRSADRTDGHARARARARERRIILTVSMASGSWQRESTAPFLYKLLYKRSHLNKFLLILVCGIGADPNSTIHYSFLNYSPSCTYLYNKYFIYQNWPSTIVSLMACNLFIILSKVNLFSHHLTSDSTYKQ